MYVSLLIRGYFVFLLYLNENLKVKHSNAKFQAILELFSLKVFKLYD